MPMTRGWTTLLRTSAVALGLAAAAAGPARADAINGSTLLAYDTVGSWIDTKGVTGAGTTDLNALKFVPVAGGALSPSSLSLAAFQSKALEGGQSVSYNDTPFHIKFTATGINGVSGFTPNETPIDVAGRLNGTLNGGNQSNVVATFDKPAETGSYSFATGLYHTTLKVPDNPLTIVPSTTNNGLTTAQGFIETKIGPSQVPSPAQTPEPSTVVLFAATAAGLGLRHRARKAQAAV